MSVLTVEDLRARCNKDPHGCWLWKGATASDGTPRIHTLDHARLVKRTMSGPMAAWNIAYDAAPRPGCLVMRGCGTRLCLNPAHLREMRSKKAIGEHIRLAGWRVGTALEQRRENIKLAHAANGIRVTPPEVVRAIRQADKIITGEELAALHGIARQTVSLIRLGKSHKGVL